MARWLIERLQEPSTWRGLALLTTASGVSISPEAMEAIIPVGLAVAGMLGAFTKDR